MREFETQENAFYIPRRENSRGRLPERIDMNNLARRFENNVSWRHPLANDLSRPDDIPERPNTEGVDE